MLWTGTVTTGIQLYTVGPGSLHSTDWCTLNRVLLHFLWFVISILLARDANFCYVFIFLSVFAPINNTQETTLQMFWYRLTISSVFIRALAQRDSDL